MTRRLHLQYLAGFVDGEGCIGITKSKPVMAGWEPRYSPYLAITNTNLPLLERIRAMYPIGRRILRTTSSAGRRPCYQLRFDGLSLHRVLEDIGHLLIDKRDQAQTMVCFLATLRGPGHHRRRLPTQTIRLRDHYYRALRAMKRVHYQPQPK